MKQKILLLISLLVILSLVLTACELPIPAQTASEPEPAARTAEQTSQPGVTPTPEIIPEVTEMPAEAVEETEENQPEEEEEEEEESFTAGTYGPTDFPENINPLTGLPVADPEILKLPPALISISNFPASARPQSGINTSPIVFELAIGEGMTRFLALFYGGYPQVVSGQAEGQAGGGVSSSDGLTGSGGDDNAEGTTDGGAATASQSLSIGPIRSGRLPYEDIRSIYSGFLVMASAYSGVAQNLSEFTNIFGSDSDDINGHLIDVEKLTQIAQSRADRYPGSNFNLEGMMFSPEPPEGGRTADRAWVFYSNLNQIQWQYDAALGGYVRYDIKTDGSGEFVMATDRLTGKPVSRENVIVIFAQHDFLAPTLIDIQLTNIPPMKALLFRDGEIHEIFWTSQFGDYEQQTGLLRPMRFVNADGSPVALKNGHTWVQIVTTASYFVESEISDEPFYPIKESEGTGLWLVRYKGTY